MREFLERVVLIASAACVGCKTLPLSTPSETHSAISQADLRHRLSILADDSMLGRSALNSGHDRAVRYIAAEAARMGLQPAGENGTYFQTFAIRERKLDPVSRIIVGDSVLRPVTDFKVFPFGRGELRPVARAQVIFGGIVGDTSGQINAQQAANRLVLLGVPGDMTAERVYANVVYGPTSRFKDAAAVMIASLDYLPLTQRGITSSVGVADTTEPMANTHPTSILVSRHAAELLLGRGIEHADVGALGRIVNGSLQVDEVLHPTRNVIAILSGSDSVLRHQYVALGAHSDHLGITSSPLEHDSVRAYALQRMRHERPDQKGPGPIIVNVDSLRRLRPPRTDSIYNGADDDGSGSVALLEIAEQFASTRDRPKRSLLFVWHAAEEMGLIGSGWFTDHPTVPLDSIAAQLSLDMVGRGDSTDLKGGGPDYLQVIGASRRSTALEKLVEEVNRMSPHPFTLVESDPNGLFCRSDQWSYARFGIPIAFFTTGPHADYHQVTDEIQYIDYVKLERVSRFIREIASTLANSSARFEPPGRGPKFAAFCTG
jgi:Peptidase family M28